MKKMITFCFLLGSIFLFAQFIDPKISLQKDWQTSATFKGKVAGQPITMYLEYLGHSGWHDKVFTVKGWYYYDKYKQKIPLMGFYNGNLMLYNFDSEQGFKQISDEESFCWTSPCPEFSNYNEFLQISQGSGKSQNGKMKHNGKQYRIQIFKDDLDITLRNEWLNLPNGKKYNLRRVLDEYGGNEIISTFEDKKENRILFYFERDSNFNKQGFCGASEPETGYRILTFDKHWKIRKFQVYSTNSCLANVFYHKEYKTKYDFVKAFFVVYENTLNLLVLNLKNATFSSTVMRYNYDPSQHMWVW
ncbi:hypothetical protein [Chryseobacterium koreense]|uniref:Uncharacterized protein n=1 Tax=Chryseobacterium koreense CCUG 49689 TaxID=1304281 RepID=A0A0J7J1J5_9FLAO|nr:hypothetical protein [Chryseobacterium koreense]KMQ72112.1 hypothetical protein ACM44_03600 [Chryseobacterium koreense CCUG 49689]MBB5332008.1 hypothetical protein [Chryseobacterium koreense]